MTTPFVKTDAPPNPTPVDGQYAGYMQNGDATAPTNLAPGAPNAVGHRHDGVDQNSSGVAGAAGPLVP